MTTTTTIDRSVAQASALTAEQVAALAAPLSRANVKQRDQGRGKVSYIEGWVAIAEANRIFGFDGWQRETVALQCVSQAERRIGREPSKPSDPPQRDGWGVTYTARVRVIVAGIVREGSGAGHGIDVDLGQAHESALKEAETDAMKRALMTFGNPFGLALYDKQQRQVTSSATGVPARGDITERSPRGDMSPHSPNGITPNAAAGNGSLRRSPAGNGHASNHQPAGLPSAAAVEEGVDTPPEVAALLPLDGATIRRIHTTIRRLPQPQLEGFTKAFRKRFQVPEVASSIADRINQKQHHDWIEAYLVQHQTVA
ncbi:MULTISPECIES: RAD52 family DNA repair protein [unclassified Cyanobium]|uniref:RAD52 family DNA repair protein n=1 Tax=unclassified Cyanobium TaxID=2627006 RepID=UPI0020CDB217|nr:MULTISPECIES: RAD52 family DNA repair protein [unclassified Cyanobium]MCP9860353.1 RAD52 family DNA repair protein [Cyanobium sp. Cruz-8H5]MCP9867663.1 RAD52 family DNA repair protein [Cyanobium sp. Cruz-8D1]